MAKMKNLHQNYRWAMVNDKHIVINVCMWDGDPKRWQPPAGITMIQSPYAAVGDFYDESNKKFIKAADII